MQSICLLCKVFGVPSEAVKLKRNKSHVRLFQTEMHLHIIKGTEKN